MSHLLFSESWNFAPALLPMGVWSRHCLLLDEIFMMYVRISLKDPFKSLVARTCHREVKPKCPALSLGWTGRGMAGPRCAGLSCLLPFSCAQAECCGWDSFLNWTSNEWLMNSTNITYPCSCKKREKDDDNHLVTKGFCQASSNQTQSGNNPEEWPVYKEVCERMKGWGSLWSQALQFLHSTCPFLSPFLSSPSLLPFLPPWVLTF